MAPSQPASSNSWFPSKIAAVTLGATFGLTILALSLTGYHILRKRQIISWIRHELHLHELSRRRERNRFRPGPRFRHRHHQPPDSSNSSSSSSDPLPPNPPPTPHLRPERHPLRQGNVERFSPPGIDQASRLEAVGPEERRGPGVARFSFEPGTERLDYVPPHMTNSSEYSQGSVRETAGQLDHGRSSW